MFFGVVVSLIFLFFLFPLLFYSFSLAFVFLSFNVLYLGCWRAYVVPAVATMAWHYIVYSLYSITVKYVS